MCLQMADHHDILRGIQRAEGVKYTALTPNIKGFQEAVRKDANR